MKKIALMVLVAAFAATPAVAASKKKAKAAKPAVAAKVDTNEASRRLVIDAIPSMLPTPLKMIYFSQPEHKK